MSEVSTLQISKQASRNSFAKAAFSPYPRNQWYVAAGREEVGRTPFARKLLGKQVVLFRKEDGTPVAMDDHCPHRGYPLSKSRIKGDLIQCGYHGLEFNEHGHCVKIPGRQAAPSALRITSYPLVEKWHWIWIWMGDPQKVDPTLIPSAVDLSDYPTYNHRFVDPMPFAGNFVLAHENLLDASHASYIHAGRVDNEGSNEFGAPPSFMSVDGNVVTLIWDHANLKLPDYVIDVNEIPVKKGSLLNRRTKVRTTLPCQVDFWTQFFECRPDFSWDNAGTPINEIVTAIAIVPADESHAYHFVAQSASYPLTPKNKSEIIDFLSQDIGAFGEVQRTYNRNPDAPEVIIPGDRAAVAARRIIEQMIQREEA
jgi:phenylpropionate dioxygenase-like ring-hydroxylating dioxygenase large terminal subunit